MVPLPSARSAGVGNVVGSKPSSPPPLKASPEGEPSPRALNTDRAVRPVQPDHRPMAHRANRNNAYPLTCAGNMIFRPATRASPCGSACRDAGHSAPRRPAADFNPALWVMRRLVLGVRLRGRVDDNLQEAAAAAASHRGLARGREETWLGRRFATNYEPCSSSRQRSKPVCTSETAGKSPPSAKPQSHARNTCSRTDNMRADAHT